MFLSGRWKSTSSEMRVGSSGTSALQCGCWVLLFPQGSPALTTSCFTMSGKSTNPAVLHFIWITLMFLTAAVTADCRGNRCRTQIQGFWRMADRQKASDQRDFRGGFRDTHKSFRGPKSSNSQSNQGRGENFKSLLSRSKSFSKEKLRKLFSRFKAAQPRKTRVGAERRLEGTTCSPNWDLKTKISKILPARSSGWGSFWERTVLITVLTQTIGLKWSPSAHGPTLVGSKYRTVDGSCNNAENPLLGMAAHPSVAFWAPPTYPGFDNTPRKAVDGSQLPSAREVTQTVFSLYAGIGPVDTPQCCLKDPVGRDWLFPRTVRFRKRNFFRRKPRLLPKKHRFWANF